MRQLTSVIILAVIAGGFIIGTRRLDAKPEYSKKEKATCVTCHVKAGAKDLNEKGTYYKKNKSLPPAK